MNYLKQNKPLLILGFVFLLIALIILVAKPPATGYEISIYDQFPLYFWFLLIGAISIGIIILIKESFHQSGKKSWVMGFFLLMFTNFVLLIIPFSRGYATFGRGDVLNHLGFIKDIIFYGYFGSPQSLESNLYPLIHILVSTIYFLTGITPETLTLLLPITFTIFYMLSIYLLANEITKNNSQVILVTAFGSLLLFKHENLMLAPSVMAFLLLPFILFVYFAAKERINNGSMFSFLLIIMLFILPFLHPGEGTIFIIIILTVLDISLILFKKINNHFSLRESISYYLNKNSIQTSLILFIAWITWFTSYAAFGANVKSTSNWLFNEVGNTTADKYVSILDKSNLSLLQFIESFFKMYGQQTLYFILALFICLLVLYLLFKKVKVNLRLFQFGFLFLSTIIIMFICFTGIFGLDFNREMRYAIFAATLVNGIGYSIFIKKLKNYKMFAITLLTCILILSASISVFNTYSSPIVRNYNFQVSNMEFNGIEWFNSNRNVDMYVESIDPKTTNRLVFALEGMRFRNQKLIGFTATEHFNYTNTSWYGSSLAGYSLKGSKMLPNNSYFIDYNVNRIFYLNVFPDYQDQWRFTPDDFYKLDNMDTSVNKIYSNGEFWVYYVNKI